MHHTPCFSGEELATYAVCPEAWRLKHLVEIDNRSGLTSPPRNATVLRKEWTQRQELSKQLSSYAKVAYLLLVALAVVVFLLDYRRVSNGASTSSPLLAPEETSIENSSPTITNFFHKPLTVPSGIINLLLVLGLLIFMWDLFERRSRLLKRDGGLPEHSELLSAKGSSTVPNKVLISKELGLSAKPDAVIQETGNHVPVFIYPFNNKVHDRHVLPLLASLMIIELENAKRPEFGILVMGKKQRRVQIAYSLEKQRWLTSIIEEMRSIHSGVPAVPSPSIAKCKNCDVRSSCQHSAVKY